MEKYSWEARFGGGRHARACATRPMAERSDTMQLAHATSRLRVVVSITEQNQRHPLEGGGVLWFAARLGALTTPSLKFPSQKWAHRTAPSSQLLLL